MKIIDDKTGKVHSENHPDYLNVEVSNLKGTVSELLTAMVDLQHRVSRLDGEDLQWPGDTYEPRHTNPAEPPAERIAALEARQAEIRARLDELVTLHPELKAAD
jgi:hypothetical protein